MEVGNAEAEARRGLEAAGGGVHADGGWSEGVFGREDESAPVLSTGVWGFGSTCDQVMPLEDVGFRRVCGYVGRWVGLEGGVFASEAFVRGFGGHDGGCD